MFGYFFSWSRAKFGGVECFQTQFGGVECSQTLGKLEMTQLERAAPSSTDSLLPEKKYLKTMLQLLFSFGEVGN